MQYATFALNTASAIDSIAPTLKRIGYNLCLDAVESGVIVRHWYEDGGKEKLEAVAVVALLAFAAMVFMVAAAVSGLVWLVRNADRFIGLDGDLCPCVGGGIVKDEQDDELTVDDAQVHVFTAWAFDKFGRTTTVDVEGVMAWASELMAA